MAELENLDFVRVALHPSHQVDPVVGTVDDEVIASFAADFGNRREDSENHRHLAYL